MSRSYRLLLVTVALAALVGGFLELPAGADTLPKWAAADLANLSDAILTGRVVTIATGWDGDTVYTYVTLDVGQVLKGWVPEHRVVVKQLGGRVGDRALVIEGQATFTEGEDVIIFLEVRPRDRSVATTALWQGKWTIETDRATGQAIASRTDRTSQTGVFRTATDTLPLLQLIEAIPPPGNTAIASRIDINFQPREARLASVVHPVDASEIFFPLRQQLTDGPSASGCFFQRGQDRGQFMAVNTRCQELSPTGGTLSISGAWLDGSMQELKAGIMYNDGPVATHYRSTAAGAPMLGPAVAIAPSALFRSTQTIGAASTIQTTRVSVLADGTQANGSSSAPSISADGRYVVFVSQAPNLTGAAAGLTSVILRDVQTGETVKVGDGPGARITNDGRYVLFGQTGQPSGSLAVYDRPTRGVTLLTPPPSSIGGSSQIVSVSDDIRYVVSISGTQCSPQVSLSLNDRLMGTTTTIFASSGSGLSVINEVLLSPDGRYLAYGSGLCLGGHAAFNSLVVRDLQLQAGFGFNPGQGVIPIAFSANGELLTGPQSGPAYVTVYDMSGRVLVSRLDIGVGRSWDISANGRFVSYSSARRLGQNVDENAFDVYVYDLQTTATSRMSVTGNGATPNGTSSGFSGGAAVDNSGRVAYVSSATNLVSGDTNGVDDIFLTSGGIDALIPSEPSALAGAVTRATTTSTVTLTWNAPAAAALPASYVIQAGSAPGLNDLANFSTGNTNTSFSADVAGNATFFVRVLAASSVGVSVPSNEIVVTVGTSSSTPGPPSALVAGVGGSTVTLTWAPPASGGAPTAYVVEAGSRAGASDLANFSTGNAATSFIATNVGAGTYFVRVRASNGAGVSPPSADVPVVVITGCTAPPSRPTGLAFEVSGSTVTLRWTASTGIPTAYVVQAGSKIGLADLAAYDTGSTATSLTATNVAAGTYFVQIRSENVCGLSQPSDFVLITVR